MSCQDCSNWYYQSGTGNVNLIFNQLAPLWNLGKFKKCAHNWQQFLGRMKLKQMALEKEILGENIWNSQTF